MLVLSLARVCALLELRSELVRIVYGCARAGEHWEAAARWRRCAPAGEKEGLVGIGSSGDGRTLAGRACGGTRGVRTLLGGAGAVGGKENAV